MLDDEANFPVGLWHVAEFEKIVDDFRNKLAKTLIYKVEGEQASKHRTIGQMSYNIGFVTHTNQLTTKALSQIHSDDLWDWDVTKDGTEIAKCEACKDLPGILGDEPCDVCHGSLYVHLQPISDTTTQLGEDNIPKIYNVLYPWGMNFVSHLVRAFKLLGLKLHNYDT